MKDDSSHNRQAIPLSLLFLIITGCAVMAAALSPLTRDLDLDEPEQYLTSMFGGALAGVVLGGLIGLFQFHRLAGVLWGVAIGAALGFMAGLMMRVPVAQTTTLIQAVLIGSAILLVTAWLIRPTIPEPDEVIEAMDITNEVTKPRSAPTSDPRDTSA